MWKKFVYVLNYLESFKAVQKKTIHRRTHRNKTKKSCWRQLLISKSLLSYGRKDIEKECFRYKTKKMNTKIEFCIFELI